MPERSTSRRILFVSAARLERALGGAKPFVELAAEFERLSWHVEIVSLAALVPGDLSRMRHARAQYLRDLLSSRASEFDVVDFDHEYLPYSRGEFPDKTLLVARSVLLGHQVAATSFPRPLSVRKAAGVLFAGRKRRENLGEILRFAARSTEQADLVNVCNQDDAELLMGSGVPSEKIVVMPYGLAAERRSQLAALLPGRGDVGSVAFVGTFDWRKGAADMPKIVEWVVREIPGTRFRLLGTKSFFPTADDVLRQFPSRLRSSIEVVPSFTPDELPSLLQGCALGFFPSYLEGFPFAVLEMLASALPVYAYDVPGPGMMLDPEFLVPPRQPEELARRIVAILRNPVRLLHARVDAVRRAGHFQWQDIAERTADLYEERLASLRAASSPVSRPALSRGRASREMA